MVSAMVGCAGSAQSGGDLRRKETLAQSEKIGYALEQSENLVTKSVPVYNLLYI